jgi:NADH:ubiquinone reductase (H+-translocating)
MGEVTGVDRVRRMVTVRETGEFGYDYLILATGAAYCWFGHDEWATHATVLKSLEDAESIKLRLLSAFEWAEILVEHPLDERLKPAQLRLAPFRVMVRRWQRTGNSPGEQRADER